MIIVQITDTHISLDEPRGAARIRDLETCIADINGLARQPDIVIHTGDIAHNGLREEYHCAAEILKKLKAPLRVMAGNRDDRSELRRAFAPICGLATGADFIQFTVDLADVKLIALDSTTDTTNKGLLCDARLAFLDKALGEDPATPALLFMHHAPVDIVEAIDPFQFISRENAQAFQKIIEKHSHAMALICGHSHRTAVANLGNLPVITTPSVASNLRQGVDRKETDGLPVYRVHEIGQDGIISTALRQS